MKNKIKLKKLSLSDTEELKKFMDNKKILKEESWPIKKYTIKHAKQEIKKSQDKKNNIHKFGIFLDNKIIGKIGLINPNINKKIYEVGYIISEKYRGQGVATQALKNICAIGFKKMKLKRIWAKIMPNNKISQKVLIKSKFKKEGHLKKSFFLNGKYNDEIIYGRTQ